MENNVQEKLNEINTKIEELTKEKMQLLSEINPYEYVNINNIYVCLFDNNKIALFKRKDIYGFGVAIFERLDDRSCIGIKSIETNFYTSNDEVESLTKTYLWYKKGEYAFINNRKYEVTCNIHSDIKLDEIIGAMHYNNIIKYYEQGMATIDEINDALVIAAQSLIKRKNYLKKN